MTPGSPLIVQVFRLTPGVDLKRELAAWARREQVTAAILLTAVGSLIEVHLRYANQKTGTRQTGHFEILSLSGMLDATGMHLHLSIADGSGQTYGGHLLDGCVVYTTVEIAVGILSSLQFRRELDATYGFQELVVQPRGGE